MENETPSVEEIASWFDNEDVALADLKAAREIISAIYETGWYDGEWKVVYIDRNGELQVNSGSHCSCNGPSW